VNCEEATKLMDGYLNGELDPITSQSIEQHWRDCPNCDHAFKTRGSLINSCFQQREPLTTKRPPRYGGEFNPRFEKKSPTGRCAMSRAMLSRCSQEGSQSRAPFFWEHHGIA